MGQYAFRQALALYSRFLIHAVWHGEMNRYQEAFKLSARFISEFGSKYQQLVWGREYPKL